MNGLAVVEITKMYGAQPAVDHISLHVPRGELVCFLGPSGCGKTTLMRIIAGLEQPDSGSIVLEGQDITHRPVHERNFGMVFQALALFPHLSVAENIGYSLKIKGIVASERQARVAELLSLIDLAGVGQRRIDQLSGGQRQRVAIARALAQQPAVFLMDEPLSALDARLRDHMQLEIRRLQQKLKITTIFVTHDQREAMTIADRIVVMANGRVQQIGTPGEIYHQPANRFVANFIGQSNLIEVEALGGGAVRLGDATLAVARMPADVAVGATATLCIRPEDVLLGAPGTGLLQGDIMQVRDLGSSIDIRLRCQHTDILASTTAAQWRPLAAHTRIGVSFPADAAQLLSH